MKSRTLKFISMPAFAVLVALGTGCASTSALEEVRAMAEEAKSMASSASSEAQGASAKADAAANKADQAMDAATDAQACCKANTERMDRMFKQTMQK